MLVWTWKQSWHTFLVRRADENTEVLIGHTFDYGQWAIVAAIPREAFFVLFDIKRVSKWKGNIWSALVNSVIRLDVDVVVDLLGRVRLDKVSLYEGVFQGTRLDSLVVLQGKFASKVIASHLKHRVISVLESCALCGFNDLNWIAHHDLWNHLVTHLPCFFGRYNFRRWNSKHLLLRFWGRIWLL